MNSSNVVVVMPGMFTNEGKQDLTLWERSLPEFHEEPVNKRYRAELDFGVLDRT